MKIKFFKVVYRAGQYSKRKLNKIYNLLPPKRKIRIDQVDNRIYREFLIVEYYLVTKKLKMPMTEDFCYTDKGKPYFVNAKLNFSISHSQNQLMVVFSKNKVGVDIQHLLPFDEQIAKNICNESELQKIQNSKDHNLAFTLLWTQKESLVKMHGTSLYSDVKNILTFDNQYIMKTYIQKKYVISVCVENIWDVDVSFKNI